MNLSRRRYLKRQPLWRSGWQRLNRTRECPLFAFNYTHKINKKRNEFSSLSGQNTTRNEHKPIKSAIPPVLVGCGTGATKGWVLWLREL